MHYYEKYINLWFSEPFMCWLVVYTFVIQLCSSFFFQHCKEDENFIEHALSSGPIGGGMTIFDARSFAAVQGNKLMVCSKQ